MSYVNHVTEESLPSNTTGGASAVVKLLESCRQGDISVDKQLDELKERKKESEVSVSLTTID